MQPFSKMVSRHEPRRLIGAWYVASTIKVSIYNPIDLTCDPSRMSDSPSKWVWLE